MGLFGIFGKKNNQRKTEDETISEVQPTHQEASCSKKKDGINLKSVLNEEGIHLLLTDLGCVAAKMPDTADKAVLLAVQEMIKTDGIIPKEVLDLCIVSTQDMIDGAESTFGFIMPGHAALLEKLKSLQESSAPDGKKEMESAK